MTEQNIYDIIKMRMAVYKAGVKAGFWEGVDQSGASEMMNYIFPKSGNIAYYNLVMELMRKAHGMFLGGVFYLFKLPAQIERMIMDYLKKEKWMLQVLVTMRMLICRVWIQLRQTIALQLFLLELIGKMKSTISCVCVPLIIDIRFRRMSNHSHICNDKEYEIYDCIGEGVWTDRGNTYVVVRM